MPDLLIPDVDEAVIARLRAAAERRGLSLGGFVADMLENSDPERDVGLVGEIAAMRASQPAQDSDAVEDLRRLRDGGSKEQDAARAA